MAAVPAPQPAPDDQPRDKAPRDQDDVVRLQGRGVVYRDGQRLGETGYDLMIVPPHHRRATLEPGNPPSDRPDITGFFTDAFYIGEDAQGGRMTLVLEDGRRLDFRVLVPDTNEIIGLGDLHP